MCVHHQGESVHAHEQCNHTTDLTSLGNTNHNTWMPAEYIADVPQLYTVYLLNKLLYYHLLIHIPVTLRTNTVKVVKLLY